MFVIMHVCNVFATPMLLEFTNTIISELINGQTPATLLVSAFSDINAL